MLLILTSPSAPQKAILEVETAVRGDRVVGGGAAVGEIQLWGGVKAVGGGWEVPHCSW